MALNFGFGAFQDLLLSLNATLFLNRYSILLTALTIFIIIIFSYIQKKRSFPRKFYNYLHILFIVLIALDVFQLANRARQLKVQKTLTGLDRKAPESIALPDFYFILTDGYSGRIALKKYMDIDNHLFEENLQQRGFFVADSSFSNYNFTVFSVASMLNLGYLPAKDFFEGRVDLPFAFNTLRNNRTAEFLRRSGYSVYNYSIFDLENSPTVLTKTLLNFDRTPLYSQTFAYRLWKDMGYHFLKFTGPGKSYNDLDTDLLNNQKADSLTKQLAGIRLHEPKFVYTHLVMPHWPYYFDSTGNRIPDEKLNDDSHADPALYGNYLKYVNNRLLALIDEIKKKNTRPAVIFLISDHGCRDCIPLEKTGKDQCLNLNAVFLPDKNYSGLYKGITNINLMRIVLNKTFNQKIPLVKDSSILIHANERSLH